MDRRAAAVVLAAGASTRLGAPKQLTRVGGERLLERAVRVAREAELEPVVVLGAYAAEIQTTCDLAGIRVVENADWADGMGTSVRLGAKIAEEMSMDALVLMTCDQPAVSAEHLLGLLQEARRTGVAASAYGGRRGVPAAFGRSWFGRLQELTGDAGARALLVDAVAVPLADGELDVDTAQSLAEARRRFGGG